MLDDFLNDRIVHAQRGIVDAASKKISDGDVVLTYAHSNVIETLLRCVNRVRFYQLLVRVHD